jgi:dienelactone hydrolase
MSNQPKITVTPKRAMMDVPLGIELVGFPPEKKVTIRSASIDHKDIVWKAEGLYETDNEGRVNLNDQAPICGTYKYRNPMGLIWTMAPESKEIEVPYYINRPDQLPWSVTFEVWMEDLKIASETVIRLGVADGSKRIEVQENGIMGVLYLPPGNGPFPAITTVSGSDGGLSEPGAALYASHGYATLALAYFNYKTLPKNLYEIPLEYFQTSIQYLQSREDIDSERLAITGASRGGELALLLGSIFPRYKTVIADVPSGIVWGGIGDDLNDNRAAWIYKGKAIPFVDTPNDQEIWSYLMDYEKRGEPIPLLPGFMETLKRYPELVKKAEIAVEKINGAILLVSGEDDQMWPSSLFSDMVIDRLKRMNFDKPYDHLKYPGAGHGIYKPYYPNPLDNFRHPVAEAVYAMGGTPEADNRAGVDA